MSNFKIQGLGPPSPPTDAQQHGALPLERRKGKMFC